MKRISVLLGGAIVAAGLSAGVFAHEGKHKDVNDEKIVTIEGEVIDMACFTASEGDAKGTDHAECAQKCMATGIPAGILPEGKGEDDALIMLTNPKVFAPYAAQTIKVEGVVYDEKHAIDVKKAYVKDGEHWKEIALDDEHHKMGGDDMKDHAKGMKDMKTDGDKMMGDKDKDMKDMPGMEKK